MSRTVLLTLFTIGFLLVSFSYAANYNMIVEPVSNVVNFPLNGYGEFEFSYATSNGTADPTAVRTVMIAFDLQNTGLTGDSCYIGNGLVESTNFIASYLDRYTVVRAPVDKDNFYQVVCRFKTPSDEKVIGQTTALIAELPADTAGDDLKTVILNFINPPGDLAPEDLVAAAHMVSDVTIPNLVTEEPVFSFKYVIRPQGRSLLNSTEIDFIRRTHGSFVNIKNPDQDVLDYVLAVDHYAQIDFTEGQRSITGLVLNIYTKGTSSQFDFALGLERRVKPLLAEYSNPLDLISLSYDVSWVYRSNCFNGKFDEIFDETAIDCGNPLQAQCGHCSYLGRTDDGTGTVVAAPCSDPTQCASGICEAGFCDVELGKFVADTAMASSILLAMMLCFLTVFLF